MSAPVPPPSPSSSFNVSWDEYPASKGYIFAVWAGVRKVLFAIEIESKRYANCGGGYVKVGGGGGPLVCYTAVFSVVTTKAKGSRLIHFSSIESFFLYSWSVACEQALRLGEKQKKNVKLGGGGG